VYNVLIAKN